MSIHAGQMSLDQLSAEDPYIRLLARIMRDGRGRSLAAAVAEACEIADPAKVHESAAKIADLAARVTTAQSPRAVVAGNIETWYPGPRKEDKSWPALVDLLEEQGWDSDALQDLDTASTKIVAQLPNPHGVEEFHCRGLVLGYVQSGKTT